MFAVVKKAGVEFHDDGKRLGVSIGVRKLPKRFRRALEAAGLRDLARRVTLISKVKTRVRLRCEAEAVWLLNVFVIPQR
jgi:hypothetical protein